MITPVLIGKYLSQQCTPDEAQMIEAWIGQSSQNAGIFNHVKKIWEETGKARPQREVQDTDAAWQKIKSRISVQQKAAKKRKPLSFITSVAAAAVVIFTSMIIFYLTNNNNQQTAVAVKMVELSTRQGEKRQLTLADGSTVWLNAETTIKYPENFEGETREVYLDGEAYFEVKPNAEKPFKVYTGELVTQVLGTSFNVMAYPEAENVEVALDEGKVALSFENQKLELKPGRKAAFGKTAHTFTETDVDDKHNQWRNNIIDFNNVTLHEAAVTLQRWFGHKVVIDNQKLETCRITASFSNPTEEEVMEILSSVLPLEIEKKDGAYHISGTSCD